MELNELLKLMNANTLKYIKNYDIDALNYFIAGYMKNRRSVVKNLTESENLFYKKFSKWVRIYYNEKKFSTRWQGFILFHCNGNHEKAVKKFFELYQQWYKEEFNKEPW